jgi:hypothetical protein
MAITINGTGTITGISAGGYPDATVTADDLASNAVTTVKINDGAVTAAKLASGVGGKILNVATVQINSTSVFNSTSGHARFSAMDSSYTTTQSNSKILVIQNWMLSKAGANADSSPKIFRKIGSGTATEILVNPSLLGSSTSGWIGVFRSDAVNSGALRPTLIFLDDPGHTAGDVITYEHHWRTETADSVRLNQGAQSSNTNHATTTSQVIFLEVG